MDRPPPPKPPKPGKVMVYRAQYNYTAQQADELSFSEGDLLYVTDSTSSAHWWEARCGNKTGLIPYNYVAEHAESIAFPLHDAAKRGNISFLEECINNKVSVNSLDKSGSTPLYWAAHSGFLDGLKLLLVQSNVNISAQNKLGDTPLHAAAWKGHADCVQVLLQAGARSDLANIQGKLPHQLANDPDTAALLQRASGDDVFGSGQCSEISAWLAEISLSIDTTMSIIFLLCYTSNVKLRLFWCDIYLLANLMYEIKQM